MLALIPIVIFGVLLYVAKHTLKHPLGGDFARHAQCAVMRALAEAQAAVLAVYDRRALGSNKFRRA